MVALPCSTNFISQAMLLPRVRMICIPSTSGTASEVSRSIVISDKENNIKQGIGDMEMMPDIALLEPHGVTAELVAREIRLGTGAVVASTWQAIYPESEVPEWE